MLRGKNRRLTLFSTSVSVSGVTMLSVDECGVLPVAARGGAFWAGQWHRTDRELAVHDPQDGALVGIVADGTPAEVDEAVRAVAAAQRAVWPLWQRREVLAAAAGLLGERAEPVARLISREGSKTLAEARREVTRATETLRLSAEEAGRLVGQTLPLGDTARGAGRIGWWTPEPVGVVAAVTPFNDPLNLVAHKLGPALIAGNGVVLKPAEATPLTALAVAEVLLDAGVPPGRLAVLPGRGQEAGAALVSHPLVDLVSFTGGWPSGDAVARAAGAKRLLMELGGNCPVLVLPDADVAAAAAAIVAGAFGAAGQSCLSVQRVYVHTSLAQHLTELVARGARALRVGDKADPRTDVGPLIDQAAASRIQSWVAEARDSGAVVETGGQREGAFHWPTVLTGVPTGARVLTEEVFGPVVSIATFTELDHAVQQANDTAYGLQAGVFTRGLDTALEVAAALRVGAVMLNDTSDFRIDAMPFGGRGRSGVGREGVHDAVVAMTEPKVTLVRAAA